MPYSESLSIQSAPADLAGPAFDEAMASVPIAFLESYPLPAFVCCVRTGRVRKEAYTAAADLPERPPMSHFDTGATVVGHGSRRSRSSGTGSGSSSGTGSRSQASAATSSASMSRSASRNTTMSSAQWSWRRLRPATYHDDEEDERNDNVLPLQSVSSSSSRLAPRGGSPFASMLTVTVDQPCGSTSCVWHNAQWSKVVGDFPLDAIVDRSIFSALEGWVEANIETRNNNSRIARDSTQFSLDVQGSNLQLLKTRHDKHPPGTILWIVTCTKLTERVFGPLDHGPSGQGYAPPTIVPLAKSLAADDPHSCAKLLETTDWFNTPIGPRSSWPLEISAMVSLVLITVPPVALWISDALIGVYNQEYAKLSDHPNAFGKGLREMWSMNWDEVEPLVAKALGGEPAEREKGLILYRRDKRGRYIEKHHSFSFHPIFGKSGKVLGVWNPTQDHTETVLAERRLRTTTKLVEEVSFARTPHELYQMTTEVLSHNPTDAPFAMLYSIKQAGGGPVVSADITDGGSRDLELQLESSVGVPAGHPCAIERVHLPGITITSASGSFTEECLAERMGDVKVDVDTSADHDGSHTVSVDMVHVPSATASACGSDDSRHSAHSTTSGGVERPSLVSNDNSAWPIRKALETRQCVVTAENRGSAATGVGLSIINEIVRLHNGKLFIRTATSPGPGVETGSTFTASFPLSNEPNVETVVMVPFGVYARQVAKDIKGWNKGCATPLEDSALLEGHPSLGGRSASETSGSLTSAGFTDGLMFEREDVLLIVDNDTEMRSYIKTIFERFCTVVEAASAEEASEIVKTVEPNLVISELVMRSMSGIELLHELRLVDKLRFIPMVLISSTTDDEQRVAAFVAGVDDFVSKPFKPRELLLRAHLHMQMGKKRTKLELLFAQREHELSVLSDYCPSGIMRTDASGKVLYANESFRSPAGMTSYEDPQEWFEFCDDESRDRVEHAWSEMLRGGLPATSLQWKWQTGRTMSAVLIRLDAVRPLMSGLLMCVTDISYQVERLEEAQRRRIEAEESKHQQELLVDLTSHEIRTPVSAILQCSSLVKANLVALKEQLRFAGDGGFKPTPALLADLEEDVEALESIYQCGLVQERIAGDVLSLARIQLDMLSLHFVEMDLRKEAKKVLSVFASEAKMKRIEILLELGGSLEALHIRGIKTDPVRLGQVLTNLTANAIRFTAATEIRRITVHYEVALEPPLPGTLAPPPNLPYPLVTPLAEDTPIYLYVSVADTGPGMTPEEQSLLFKRFQQSNKMIHTRYGGSGLGLFICKKITELLNGAIAVESEVGVGSVFRFWIKTHTVAPSKPTSPAVAPSPLTIPPPRTMRVGSLDSQPAEPTTPQPARSPVPDEASEALRLLVVEDNIINQTVLKRQLVKAGFMCDTANDGQEAIVRIHEANRECRHDSSGRLGGYDVVLMDLEMPVMDGLTAIRHIRDAEARGLLRPQLVIALTGNARQGQIDQARAAGMDDVIIKPYRLPALIALIRTASQSHRERWARGDEWPDGPVRVNEQPSSPPPATTVPSYDTDAKGHALLSEANVARLGGKKRVSVRPQQRVGVGLNGAHVSPEVVLSPPAGMAREVPDDSN